MYRVMYRRIKNLNTSHLGWLLLCLLPSMGYADQVNDADTAWIMTATALVLLMTLPGLAFFYSGLVRTKNALSVLVQCLVITCVISILWVLFGYSLSFADGGSWNSLIGGLGKFGLMGVDKAAVSGTIPEITFIIFQMTFAFITPALIVGGFAERMKFSSMLLFIVLWEILVYFPTCHWVWGGGWLGEMGFVDFAGGSVVHINAGVAAMVAAIMIGRRRGFGEVALPPHNLALTMGGAGLLWVGWYGFNGGSALTASADASTAILVTHLSASAAALVWGTIEWFHRGSPTALGVATGLIAGLASITPAAGVVGPLAAIFLGAFCGAACYGATEIVKAHLKIDDSLDVFTVHGVGGILGLVLLPILSLTSLGGYGPSDFSGAMSLLGTQLLGSGAILAWSLICSFLHPLVDQQDHGPESFRGRREDRSGPEHTRGKRISPVKQWRRQWRALHLGARHALAGALGQSPSQEKLSIFC